MAIYRLNQIQETQIQYLPTGFPFLDEILAKQSAVVKGLPLGRISYISGEAGVGKTRTAIAIVNNVNARGEEVIIFQGEVKDRKSVV